MSERISGELSYLAQKTTIYKNTKVKYYGGGAKLFDAEKSALMSAKSFIFLEFFIMKSGKVLSDIISILSERAKNGVKVYVIYDSIGSALRIKRSDLRILRSSGVHLLKASNIRGPKNLKRNANLRDHRKIMVIDGRIAFTGGINLSDEYTNDKERCGFWKDAGVGIEGDAVRGFSDMFIDMWNTSSKDKISLKYGKEKKKLHDKQSLVVPFFSNPKKITSERVAKNIYLEMINSARKSLSLTTPYFACDEEIRNALCRAARRGVKVILISPGIPDKKVVSVVSRANFYSLIESGVRVYEFDPGMIHAKTMIKDDKHVIVGTINLDYRSFDLNYECAIWSNDKSLAAALRYDFRQTLSVSRRVPIDKYPHKGPKTAIPRLLQKQF